MSQPNARLFGKRLRELRHAAGMSQRRVAQLAEIDTTYLSKIENGRMSPPSETTIRAICRSMGQDPMEMILLAGKVPSDLKPIITQSAGVLRFVQEVGPLELSDEQWGRLTMLVPRWLSGEGQDQR